MAEISLKPRLGLFILPPILLAVFLAIVSLSGFPTRKRIAVLVGGGARGHLPQLPYGP